MVDLVRGRGGGDWDPATSVHQVHNLKIVCGGSSQEEGGRGSKRWGPSYQCIFGTEYDFRGRSRWGIVTGR